MITTLNLFSCICEISNLFKSEEAVKNAALEKLFFAYLTTATVFYRNNPQLITQQELELAERIINFFDGLDKISIPQIDSVILKYIHIVNPEKEYSLAHFGKKKFHSRSLLTRSLGEDYPKAHNIEEFKKQLVLFLEKSKENFLLEYSFLFFINNEEYFLENSDLSMETLLTLVKPPYTESKGMAIIILCDFLIKLKIDLPSDDARTIINFFNHMPIVDSSFFRCIAEPTLRYHAMNYYSTVHLLQTIDPSEITCENLGVVLEIYTSQFKNYAFSSPTNYSLVIIGLIDRFPRFTTHIEQFVRHYVKLNNKALSQNQRDISLTILENFHIFVLLIELLGEQAFSLLNNLLVGDSCLKLIQYISFIGFISLENQRFLKLYLTNFKEKWTFEVQSAFKTILLAISLSPIELSKEHLNKSFSELKNELILSLITALFQSKEISLEQCETILTFDLNKVTKYFSATYSMKDDCYESVYLQLIYFDFFGTPQDTEDFLHDINQKNEIGKLVAHHNANIRDLLVKNGILPETALNYKKTFLFEATYDEHHNFFQETEKQLKVVLSYLQNLKEPAEKDNNKKIYNQIEALFKFLDKNKNTPLLKLLEKTDLNSKLQDLSQKLEKYPGKTAKFKEFRAHYLQSFTELNNKINSVSTFTPKNKRPIEKFKVMQWPKSDPNTFTLGNDVGCCLATDGPQFQAMVQRRMDDAMLFHVVVNEQNIPVALFWLYLAITTDKKIVLVLNFPEIAAKYAKNERIRLSILNALLKYTKTYCEDNNIKDFYLNQLDYGWNKDDLDVLPISPLYIEDKLGGPLIITPDLIITSDFYLIDDDLDIEISDLDVLNNKEEKESSTSTSSLYYLASLETAPTKFRRYDGQSLLINTSYSQSGLFKPNKTTNKDHPSTSSLETPLQTYPSKKS